MPDPGGPPLSSKRDRPRFPTTPLRVLHVAMELAPWAQVGDVGGWLDGLTRAQQAAGDRVTFEIQVRAKGGLREITNVVDVVSSTTDPNAGNNHDELLMIVKGGTGDSGGPGGGRGRGGGPAPKTK